MEVAIKVQGINKYFNNVKVLDDINFDVKKGEFLSILGPSGCGKTTLINILMRFYDVKSGEIIINGKNIKDVTREELRSNFGMVLQETWLKSGTVLENLMLGVKDATEEQIIEAAKILKNYMPSAFQMVGKLVILLTNTLIQL